MPQVPRYDSFQVQEQPLPSGEQRLNLQPDAFGAGISEGLGDVGKVFAEVAEQEQIKAEEVSLLEAERKLQEWELTNVNAALDRRGKDAIGLPDEFYPSMNRAVSDIAQAIPSERARMKFQERALGRTRGMSLTIQRHVRSEMEQYDAAQTQALIANSQEAAAMNYNDPARIAEEIEAQHEAIAARARRMGADPEVVEQLTNDATSKTHVSVLSRMLSSEQYGMAKEYFDANSEDMLAADRESVQKAVLEAGVRAESTGAADRIMASTTSRREALAQARDMEAGAVRDATVQRINQRFNEIEAIETEEKSARMEAAAKLVQDSGGDISAIPPDMYANLTAGEIRDLKALGEFTRTGMPVQNWDKWVTLRNMSPEELKNANLAVIARPYLDDQHYAWMVEAQAAVRGGGAAGGGADVTPTATRNFGQTFEGMARFYGLMPADKRPQDLKGDALEDYILLETEAMNRIAELERARGKKLGPDEIRAEVVGILSQRVNVRGNAIGFGGRSDVNVRLLEADERDRAYVPVERIPADQGQELINVVLSDDWGGRPFESLTWSEKRSVRDKVGRLYAAMLMNDTDLYLRILEDDE